MQKVVVNSVKENIMWPVHIRTCDIKIIRMHLLVKVIDIHMT